MLRLCLLFGPYVSAYANRSAEVEALVEQDCGLALCAFVSLFISGETFRRSANNGANADLALAQTRSRDRKPIACA